MQVENVLMVDDDATIRRVAEIALTHVGKFNVVLASSGISGIEMLKQSRPDVILLDVMMPGMDGPTTFGLIKKLEGCSQIPVIFMTAKVQNAEVESYYKLGAAGVILKPFDPMLLASQIQSIVNSLNVRASA